MRFQIQQYVYNEICSVLRVLVDACCDKQDSLMRDGLRHKQTSMFSALNYCTVESVDVTPLYAKARY